MKYFIAILLLCFVGCDVDYVMRESTKDISKDKIEDIHNRIRDSYELQSLMRDPTLEANAQKHSERISEFGLYHQNMDSILRLGYNAAGENIAYGQISENQVVDLWMNSSGHKSNILFKNFDRIGIGVAKRKGITYFCVVFAHSNT